MKMAFVSIHSSEDVNAWSGIPHFMSNGFIEAGVELIRVQNLKGSEKSLATLERLVAPECIKRKLFDLSAQEAIVSLLEAGGGSAREIQSRMLS